MKKSLKKVLLILFVTFMATGCVKMDVSMSINKDKSMNLVMIMAVNKQLLEQSGQAGNMMDDDDLKELREQGFEVEEYKENSMEGYKASRKIKNIDAISTKDDITSDLSMTQTNSENKYLFTVKKGFLKNTYIANITSSDSKSIEDQMNDITSDDDTTNDSTTPNNDNNTTDNLDDLDYSSLMSSMDMKFAVKVPYKALKSNATSISDDGKTLTWNLLELKEDKMHFEFTLYNMTNIYIAGGIILLIILILVFFLIKRKNNKKHNLNSNEMDINNSPTMAKPMDNIVASNTVQNIQPNSMANIPVNPVMANVADNVETMNSVEPQSQPMETSKINNAESQPANTINTADSALDNNNQIQNEQTEANQDNQQI